MIQICSSDHCTGCAACANICPKHCIKIVEDSKLGHFVPYIDQKKCIDCGVCLKTCPQNSIINYHTPLQCFAAWEKDEESYKTSASGGAAAALSKIVLNKGGVVYGCAVREGVVKHIRVVDNRDLFLLKGSKYVQSFIAEDLLIQVKNDLLDGLDVLFVGTPCQIDGLRHFLRKDYENLYLVDIVCHGVPSQKCLISHLKEQLPQQSFVSYSFRENHEWILKVYGSQSQVIYSSPVMTDLYYFGFLRGLFYKDSCYRCRYARKERVSDITIGDFWGVGSLKMSEKPKYGLSLILVNTTKGSILLSEKNGLLQMEERSVEEAVSGNKQLRFPSRRHFARGLFCRLYRHFNFDQAAKIALFFDRIIYSILLRKK